MKTENEVLQYIEKNNLNQGEKIIDCHLYNNGFEFKTELQGYKSYDLSGNKIN